MTGNRTGGDKNGSVFGIPPEEGARKHANEENMAARPALLLLLPLPLSSVLAPLTCVTSVGHLLSYLTLSSSSRLTFHVSCCTAKWFNVMFQTLYGQTAAALYAKAAGQNAQARQLYNASADTYYKANDAAAYDDWVRARNHWDYFYNRS
eukprot:766751-Hanusia_phi.AAC.11